MKLTQAINPYLLLTLLCAVLFLPGLASIPPTDRDESRFMQASKQMLESGDWVHMRFQDEPRNKKPVGIYWLQATTVRVMGQALTATWPYRLPSVLAAWIAVLLVCRCGARLFDSRAGLIAGAALATSFIVVVEAHIAKTDATLLAATVIAMTMLAEIYVGAPGKQLWPALGFWFGIGFGILIKGPVILLAVGAALTALCIADRNLRWLKALRVEFGLPLVLVMVLPWLIAVSGGNGQNNFVSDAVTQDLLPKLIGGQESHGALPGSYILAGLLTAWPWSVLAPFVLVAAWKQRTVPAVRFCLAWLIPAWIVFEIVPTKLPHYTMPLYPALALLIAWAATQWRDSGVFARWIGGGLGVAYRTLWACIAVGLAVGLSVVNHRYGDGAAWGAVLGATACVLAALLVLFGFARGTAASAVAGLVAVGVLLSLSLTSGILPHLSQLAISPRIAAATESQHTPVALAGFHEPSAVFLLGTETLLTDTGGAVAHILATPGALAVVPEETLETVRAAVAAGGRTLTQRDEIVGYNYSRGQWLRLAVITAVPQ